MIPCKIDAEGKNTGTIITISYTWRQGILFYEENFWLRILILLAIFFIAFGEKGAGTFRRIFDVESFECLKHQSARTDKELLQPQLQQQSDIDDQLNSICRFVSGIPKKRN